MGIPLPSLTTLKEWASKLHVHAGILDGVLTLMEVAAVKMSSYEKLVVIQYYEMKVMSLLEYDSTGDKVVGPHSQAQVVMVRSLFGSWKQPVFTEYDTQMTKACLDEITARLYAIGLTVVAIVSDCGGGNLGVWNEYNVSHEKTSFFSEITKKNIYFFADVPHLLKLIRNWFLDTGFVMPDKSQISSEPLRQLVQDTTNLEISACHKLTPRHINCEKFQRQNVALAAQTMSNTTSCALKRYDVCDESLRLPAANFIKLTNDWFDVMNSRVPNASIHLQCGYGVHLTEQKPVLDKYIDTMKEIRCNENKKNKKKNVSTEAHQEKGIESNNPEDSCSVPKAKNRTRKPKTGKPLQLFQKGVIMSTKFLMGLYEDLKKDLKISYILTAKLNQDSLENLFSLVRGSGGFNDHPTPLEFLYRMRLIILGKHDNLRVNANTRQTDDEFIIGKVLQKSSVPVENLVEDTSTIEEEHDSGEEEDRTNSIINTSAVTIEKPLTTQEQVSSDGLSYITGWMARKLKSKFPNFGNYTHTNPTNLEGSWIGDLSVGGLTKGTSSFEAMIQQMEKVFQSCFGETLPREMGIKQNLIKKIKMQVKEAPEEVIALFARRRIIMRIKYLNKNQCSSAQKFKKLLKITS